MCKTCLIVNMFFSSITKREALLRTSRNLLHDRPPEEMFLNDTDAALRSDRMMKVSQYKHSHKPIYAHKVKKIMKMSGRKQLHDKNRE